MANQEHLDLIRQGIEIWNASRKEHLKTEVDLYYADLSIFGLSGMDLSGANLIGADLSGAKLTEANLSIANFSRAKLNRANLRFTNLNRTDLIDADFSNAIIGNTIFGDVDLRAVKGLETVQHFGPSTIGIDTLLRSEGNIPETFLRRAGLNDRFIEYTRSLTRNPIEYYTCFISYSSKDQDFAERLYADLQSHNVRCWYAPEDMKIGDEFRARIDESIRLYDKLLLVLSQHSVMSHWVEAEVEAAFEKERGHKKSVLFPIMLDDAVMRTNEAWAAHISRTRHIGDFTCWKEYDAYQRGLMRLLRDLKAESTMREI